MSDLVGLLFHDELMLDYKYGVFLFYCRLRVPLDIRGPL